MTLFLLLLLSYILLGIICFYFGYTKAKNIVKKEMTDLSFKRFFEYTYKQKINPVTQDIYELFISQDGIKHFQKGVCTIKIPMLDISIWAVNEVLHRRLYEKHTNENAIYKKYGKTISEINDSLNMGDKTILDKICKEVLINENDLADTILLDDKYKF